MEVIVDSSVAVKWFLVEPGTAAARRELTLGARLLAPSLVVAEVCNVLWRRVREGGIAQAQAEAAMTALTQHYEELVPIEGLRGRALSLALELGHPAYDCFYLALAQQRRAQMVTADRRLLTRLSGSPHAPLARPLEPLT